MKEDGEKAPTIVVNPEIAAKVYFMLDLMFELFHSC